MTMKTEKISISEVKISLIKPQEGLIGFASLVINESIYLSSIGIHRKLGTNDFRLTYPTKKDGLNLFHPIIKEASRQIEEAIFQEVKSVMSKVYDRYSNINV